jgi:predicted thioesterase
MKQLFKPGDQKVYEHQVKEADAAAFHGAIVHAVYSTFALARDMEWSSRLFVLDSLEEDEQGIGTALSINHHSPAFPGDMVMITATLRTWEGHEIICDIEALCGDRIIASGVTGQKILKKDKLERYFQSLRNSSHDQK